MGCLFIPDGVRQEAKAPGKLDFLPEGKCSNCSLKCNRDGSVTEVEFTERYFTGLKEKIQITSQHFILQHSTFLLTNVKDLLCYTVRYLKNEQVVSYFNIEKYFGFTVNKIYKILLHYFIKE